MTNQDNRPMDPADLRQKAEALARERAARTPEDSAALSPGEIRERLHELRVHRIELEMQNEELRAAQEEIEAGRDRYFDLYDLAPVGYCTLSEPGLILEANLTVATLLGTTRGALIKQPISRFIFKDDQDIYYLHRKKLFETGEPQECELRLVKPDGALIWAHLTATAAQAEDGTPLSRVVLSDIAERKRAEEALRESGEKYRGLVEGLNDTVYRMTLPEGRYEYFSPSAEGVFGYTSEEFINNPLLIQSIIHPDSAVYFEDTWKQLLEGNVPERYEYKIIDAEGSERWIVQSNKAIFDDSGKIKALDGLCRNITERKQAVVALRASEEKYRSILETIQEGYFEVDLAGNVTFFNDPMCRTLGYSSNELMGMNNRAFMDTETAEKVYNAFNQVLTSGQALKGFAWELLTKEGEKCYVDTSVSLIKNANGEAIGFRGISRDITERKQAETYRDMGREILQILNEPGDLQESIQRVLAVLKTRTGFDAVGLRLQEGEDFPYFAQDGFPADFLLTENTLVERDQDDGVCRDKDGNIRLECTCGLVISGKTDLSSPLFTKGGSCWTNDSFPLLDLPHDQDPRLHPRNNCIHQGYASVALIPVRIQDQMHSRETCIRHGFSSIAQVPVRTSDRIVGLIQLNDKRKDRFTPETIEILEGIAAHTGSALMRKRAEAEHEKLQSQLIQAQKMESVGRLAGGVAHEFNNMLNVMLGYTELAMDTPGLSEKLHNYLQQIFSAGTQSAEVTRQLTAYARQQTIAPRKIDLNTTITDMIKILRALTKEGVSLYWQPSEGRWPVKIDPVQVNQLLTNLCVNAVDAIAGTGRITIKTEEVTLGEDDCVDHDDISPGDFVLLSVSDNGCGMDQQTLANLFEPFFTTKAVGQGTGLGLAMVYGIVKQNKGLIQVHSKPDQGSTFRLFLPRYTDDASGNKKEKDFSAKPRSYGETVLVAEDKESLLIMTREMLESLGYKVLTTTVPEEALRLAEEHPGVIDLLITDVVMPGTNGRELAEQVKALYPNIKCLYMSGHPADIITRQGVLPEGGSFIQKPFSWKDFAHKVRRILTDG